MLLLLWLLEIALRQLDKITFVTVPALLTIEARILEVDSDGYVLHICKQVDLENFQTICGLILRFTFYLGTFFFLGMINYFKRTNFVHLFNVQARP
jgi:hypothetical protein